MQASSQALVVRPLSPALGAELIGVDLKEKLPDEVYEQIVQAWHDNLIVLLRNQDLGVEDQWQFGLRFGPLSGGHSVELPGRTGVLYVSNIREDGKLIGILPDGEMQFHSDQCYKEQPSQGSMLYALQIPRVGGNTSFANCYLAYETLPVDLQQRLLKLKALNAYDYNVDATRRRSDIAPGTPTWVHPVVRLHPATQRRALYVNRLMTVRIEGMPQGESDELLAYLFDHIEQPRFIYEHVWKPGDALMWDNRCVQHARSTFDASEPRKLRRITLKGERVIAG